MKNLIAAALLGLSLSVAVAAPATCGPKQAGGTGTQALFKYPPKGCFVAWYCPGEEMPTMYVGTKSNCGLVLVQRAVAAVLSDPTTANLNAAAKDVLPVHFTDPALIAVWVPYAEEIRALK